MAMPAYGVMRIEQANRAKHYPRHGGSRLSPAALALVAAAFWGVTASEAAGPVVSFRNGGTGSYPDADPPLHWSLSKNVKWRWDSGPTGTSISSPLIVGDRVFTLAQPCTLVCLDRETGKELWRRARHAPEEPAKDDKAAALERWLLRRHRIDALLFTLDLRGSGTSNPNLMERLRQSLQRIANGQADDASADGGRKKPGPLTRRIRELEKRIGRASDDAAERAVHEARLKPLKAIARQAEGNRVAYARNALALLDTLPKEPFPGSGWGGKGKYLCAATPASDGQRVVAIFHPGLMVCYDLDGSLLWRHVILEDDGSLNEGAWGQHAASPVFADGKVLHSWGERTQLLDAKTGKLIWSRDGTGRCCASGPVVGRAGDAWYFARLSGGVYRLVDGERILDSPIPRKGHHTMAVSADGSTFYFIVSAVRLLSKADRKPTVLWTVPEEYWHYTVDHQSKDKSWTKGRHFITPGGHSYDAPVVHRGVLYYHNTTGGGGLAKIDAETGEVLTPPAYRKDIGGYGHGGEYPDLIAAGIYLFQANDEGKIFVLQAGRDVEQKVVAENPLEAMIGSSPVFQGTCMYIRTQWGLFCIAKGAE